MTKFAFIFDMDGLMIDSEPVSYRAWQMLLAEYGYELPEEQYAQMIGLRADASTELVRQWFGLEETAVTLQTRKNQYFHQLKEQEGFPLMAGLMELQAEIARRDIVWGVATSSRRAEATENLTRMGLINSVHAYVGGDEITNAKPAPDIYLLIAQQLGVNPKNCLAMEDSVPGSQAAVAAGMTTIAIPSGPSVHRQYPHAHYRFNSLHEVVNRLDELIAVISG